MNDYVRKWRVAHPDLEVPDEALASISPLPSLYVNDFVAYLSHRGETEQVVTFVRDMGRELVWAYDNWQKTQRDSKASELIADILNNCRHGEQYNFTNKFIRDYAKANNIKLPGETTSAPWFIDIAGKQPAMAEPPPGDILPPGQSSMT